MKSTTSRKPIIGLLAAAVVGVISLALPHAIRAQAPAERELMKLAVQSEKYGKLNTAETLYERVLRNNPTNQYAHHRLGVMAAQRGEFKQAIASFRNAQRSGPPSVELLNDFGAALYLTDDLETAQKLLKASLAIDPENTQAKNNLKMVLLKREWRYKQQATALMEDRAAREAIEHSRAAAQIRVIAEAKAQADLQAAKRAMRYAKKLNYSRTEGSRSIAKTRPVTRQRSITEAKAMANRNLPASKRVTARDPRPARKRIERPRSVTRKRTIAEARAMADADLQAARRARVEAPKQAKKRTVATPTPKSQESNSFLPRLKKPQVKFPQLPQVKLPEMKLPQLHLPDFRLSQLHMPEFEVPW